MAPFWKESILGLARLSPVELIMEMQISAVWFDSARTKVSVEKPHMCGRSVGEGEKGETGVERAGASLAIRHPAWHQRCSRVCLSLCPVSILHYGSALRMYSYTAPISTAMGLQSPKTVLANICSSFLCVCVWRSCPPPFRLV